MARTCLVLGGKGFVGSAIVREAGRRGWTATAAGKADLPELSGSSWDVVINANGNSKKFLSDQQPQLDFDLSVRSVSQSLHEYTFQHYVFLSTVDVYPDKSNPDNNRESSRIDPMALSRYGLHKWMAEELVRFNASSWLILRLAGFVGPGLKKNPIYDLLNGAPLRVHPDSAYQYHNSDHVAAIVFDLVERGIDRQIINVAGDGLISLRDIAQMIPGAKLPADVSGLRSERYEISIDHLKSLCPVGRTKDVVRKFIEHVQSGEVKLS